MVVVVRAGLGTLNHTALTCEALRARGLEDVEVWWTEWGVTPTHFYDVTDSVYGASNMLPPQVGTMLVPR